MIALPLSPSLAVIQNRGSKKKPWLLQMKGKRFDPAYLEGDGLIQHEDANLGYDKAQMTMDQPFPLSFSLFGTQFE